MAELKCPKCGEVFQVDESGYSAILQQVRTKEFTDELNAQLEKELDSQKKELESKREVAELQSQSEREKLVRDYEDRLRGLEEKLRQQSSDSELEAEKLRADKDAEIERLKNQLQMTEQKTESEIEKAGSELKLEAEKLRAEKDAEIERLKSSLELEKKNTEQAVERAKSESKGTIDELEHKISEMQTAEELKKKNFELEKDKELAEKISELEKAHSTEVASYETELKMMREQVEQYRDFKKKLSTKMIGESLEQHCETEFNKLRMTAFPRAHFAKDNDISTGSKGDYIYRECDESSGAEIISIMFEMKNEADTTATKHKNADFFKELDKDRKEKNCEYAVLVSTLEPDSEYYNDGIVDVSYEYPKMYVIRPQFFIPLISILRNAALNSVELRRELEFERSQNRDLTYFEENLESFKNAFAKNYDLASKQFKDAIDEIDKAIKQLEKIKKSLTSSENNLRLANKKADELTIKKLTKNAPSVRAELDEIRKNKALPDGGSGDNGSEDQ